MKISLIAAVAQNGVIGQNKSDGGPDMPWHLPDDFRFFKQKTSHHPIIMGRRTLEALGKPLPNRTNIVITRSADFQADGCVVVHSLEEALDEARKVEQEEIFVIGGGEIYSMAMPLATTLYLTEIEKAYDGETRFPDFDRTEWDEVSRRHHPADNRHETAFDFVTYEKRIQR
ncbi:type 3 dihydrofolate reductase [Nibrella saemangeumensis]|uniref:Dihydrofolate reductase n=1 Tax=Nibrella saemangeumensis TaxID=1084526 RepID=A0ABP8M9I9_9BACT